MEYLHELAGDDGAIRRYPTDQPYVRRDQGNYPADELIYRVICDIATVAEDGGLFATRDKADKLGNEAQALWPVDEKIGEHVVDGWLPDSDPDASEKLQSILQEAEQLDGISVDWDGDAGTVTVTLSEYWQEIDEAHELGDYSDVQ